jgi:predicted Mrr-cat superfamily restriction endonuclease
MENKNEIKKGDLVTVYDPKTETSFTGRVQDKFDFEDQGECYHIKTHDALYHVPVAIAIIVKEEE